MQISLMTSENALNWFQHICVISVKNNLKFFVGKNEANLYLFCSLINCFDMGFLGLKVKYARENLC